MNHPEIEQRNLVELYVTRRLDGAESARFEEHFVDCPQCLNQIENAERLTLASLPASFPAKMTGLRSAQPVLQWLAAAVFLLAVGSAMWLSVIASQRKAALERSRADALQWKQRYETGAVKAAGTPAPAADHPLVASTFALNITRSAGSAAPPSNRIPVSAATRWIALSLDQDWETGFAGLRGTLAKSDGPVVWQQDDLSAAAGAPVTLVLPSSFLPPGDYLLTLEGKTPASQFRVVGRYRFRAFRP